MENNTDNKEFEEKNREEYKSKGIIAMLLIIVIIATAALGMCASYPLIEENAKNVSYTNYFDEYDFTEKLACTLYSSYYNSLNEKAGGTLDPASTLLNIQKNIYDNDEYYDESEFINGFNSNFNYWNRMLDNQLANLKYYFYDKTNNVTKTNINYEVGVIENNIDLSSIKKDEYQFYVAINFDENGNLTINDIKGVDIQNFEYYLNIALSDFLSDNYYNSEYYNVTMNPIKNMAFVYAVPNNLVFNDSISWGIRDAETYGYQVVGGVAVMIIAALVAIAALIFPIKRANEIPLFKWVSKIPFEVWIIIVSLTVAVLIVSSGYMIHPALNGQLDHFVGFNVEWFTASKKVIWALNFINWFVGFGVVFFATLIIKYIFNLGIKEYFKRRTILGKILMFFVTIIKRTLDEITKVDLRQKNNKLIIKLLLINAVILLIITSIWFFGILVIIFYSIVLFFVIRKYVDKISEKYSKLREATSKIAQGKLDVNIEEDLGLFEPFKEDLKEIQKGFKKAVDEEVKSQKMKTDLISNVSHDLKTPLTAIITYADLLKDENLSDEKRRQYIETLDRKAQRLQVLIEDLFEISKATSGNITLNIENIDVVSLMKQTLLELEDKLEEANLSVRNNMPESKVVLPLDSQRTFRVFENLVINMTKYAMPNTRVFIDIIENEKYVEIIMKNMAAEEITFNVDTIAERFVRGDESRNTEGSGLGLAIAKSFVELQGGTFNISVDGDLFKVIITFVK